VLYKEIPFLQLTLALAGGIVTGSLIQTGGLLPLILTGLLLIFIPLLLAIVIRDSLKIFSVRDGLLVSIILFITGIVLYQASMRRLAELPGSRETYLLRAEASPEERERSVRLPARIIACNNTGMSGYGNHIMLYFRDTTDLDIIRPGTYLEISLTPRLIGDPDTTDNFDYTKYMNRKGFSYFAFAGKDFIIKDGRRGIRNNAARLREKLVGILAATSLEGEQLALTAALTLGYRDLLGEDLSEHFRRSGITHILAVSGLHVGILSVIIMSLLSFLKGRASIIRIIITVVAIWIFAFITGLSPSVTRASLMFSFLHAGKLIQRPVNNINSLLASAFTVMVIDPTVLFEAGFQLSYSAVIFILLFYKPLYRSVQPRGIAASKLWSMTVVTLLAQLGTLPFIVYYFNSIPLMSFVTNIIAIPSAFVILAGGLASIVTSPLPLFPLITSWITGKTAWLLSKIAGEVSSLPFSAVNTGRVNFVLFISLIILVPLGTSYFTRKDSVHPHLLLASLIFTLIASAA